MEATPAKHPLIPQKFSYYIILLCFGIYAIARTAVSIYGFFDGQAMFQHDIYLIYQDWALFIDRTKASDLFSHLTYLPHTWIILSPLFLLGLPLTKWAWCLICLALHLYIWFRLSQLTSLSNDQRRLFFVLYFSILSVGLTIALGNLVVLSTAAVFAAFPFKKETGFASKATSWRDDIITAFYLFLSTFKQLMVFPLFLTLLLRRPRLVILSGGMVAVFLFTSMWWARIDFPMLINGVKGGNATITGYMHEVATVSIAGYFEGLGYLGTFLVWFIWAVLFGFVFWGIRDPFIQLSALLLLSLLPIHHQIYDMIVAAPVIALLIKSKRMTAALLVTASLSGLWDAFANHCIAGIDFLQKVNLIYYQVLIFCFLAVLFQLDYRQAPESRDPDVVSK